MLFYAHYNQWGTCNIYLTFRILSKRAKINMNRTEHGRHWRRLHRNEEIFFYLSLYLHWLMSDDAVRGRQQQKNACRKITFLLPVGLLNCARGIRISIERYQIVFMIFSLIRQVYRHTQECAVRVCIWYDQYSWLISWKKEKSCSKTGREE